MSSKTAAASSGGPMGAGRLAPLASNDVDSDRLWRNRVHSELTQQRSWHVEHAGLERKQGGLSPTSPTKGSPKAASKGFCAGLSTEALRGAKGEQPPLSPTQLGAMSRDDLEALQRQLKSSPHTSEARRNFTVRSPIELKSPRGLDTAHHRRRFVEPGATASL